MKLALKRASGTLIRKGSRVQPVQLLSSMEAAKASTLYVMVTDLDPRRAWLYRDRIPQTLRGRLLQSGYDFRPHARRPSSASLMRHIAFEPIPPKSMIGFLTSHLTEKVKTKVKSALALRDVSRISREVGRGVPEEFSLTALVDEARRSEATRIALITDDQVAVTPGAIELALRVADATHADLVTCRQVDGILPAVVRVTALERWLSGPTELRFADLLAGSVGFAGTIVELDVVDVDEFPGVTRCRPVDARERLLIDYWEVHASQLSEALRQDPTHKGAGRDSLRTLLAHYRSSIAASLPTYHVHGSIGDVQDVRRQMEVTHKPLLDYFVAATHYGRFLQQFAGLQPNSHVVDVGCSWGYLGFALANLLFQEGAYIGIEVQKPAVDWASTRLSWLGENFTFKHVDLHNDFYNPAGSTPRGQVRLPVAEEWSDVVIAGSVFTHMQPEGIAGYFAELRRIMRRNAVAAFSYLDSTSFWGGEDALSLYPDQADKVTVYSRRRIDGLLAEAGLLAAREPINMRQFDRSDYQTWYFARRA